MQNLLIVEDDLIQSHCLANSICKELSNVRLYSMVSTGAEAIHIIEEQRVDIIILDLKLPDITGIDVLEFIAKNNLEKYNSSVIVYTSETLLLSKVINNKYIYNYCSKDIGTYFVIKYVKHLIDEKELNNNSLSNFIKLELDILHFDFSYNGTKYLYDCIYEIYLQKDKYNINLDREIYPIISKKYHKTKNSIKSNIFHAISMMYCDIDENILSKYFGYTITNKPKTKELINAIVVHIQRNIN